MVGPLGVWGDDCGQPVKGKGKNGQPEVVRWASLLVQPLLQVGRKKV